MSSTKVKFMEVGQLGPLAEEELVNDGNPYINFIPESNHHKSS